MTKDSKDSWWIVDFEICVGEIIGSHELTNLATFVCHLYFESVLSSVIVIICGQSERLRGDYKGHRLQVSGTGSGG